MPRTRTLKNKLCKICGQSDIIYFTIDNSKYASKCDKCVRDYRNMKAKDKNYFKLYYEKNPMKYEHNVQAFLKKQSIIDKIL